MSVAHIRVAIFYQQANEKHLEKMKKKKVLKPQKLPAGHNVIDLHLH